MIEKETFLKPETKQEVVPELRNEKVEIGNFVLEPVDREANKFHFLQNLTEWHHSCLKTDNILWEKELGGFSKEEKEAIKDFKGVIKKYPEWSEGGLVSIYTTSVSPEEREKRLKEVVSPKNREIIEKCLSTIEHPFSRIWEKNEPRILKARQEFIENLENFEASGKKESLEKDLSTFFGPPEKMGRLKTFFLIRETPGTGGDASLGSDVLTLHQSNEVPKVSVFYHELIHKIWEARPSYKKLLESSIKSIDRKTAAEFKKTGLYGKDLHDIVHETIIGSFLPNGCLGEKYFSEELSAPPEKIKDTLEDLLVNRKEIQFPTGKKLTFEEISKDQEKVNMFLNSFLAMNLVPLSQRYIEERRGVDRTYFQEALKTILSSIKRTKIFE